MTDAARNRAEAMARADYECSVGKPWIDANSEIKRRFRRMAKRRAAVFDAYFANTQFLQRMSPEHFRIYKLEPEPTND